MMSVIHLFIKKRVAFLKYTCYNSKALKNSAKKIAGWSSPVALRPRMPKVLASYPAPATNNPLKSSDFSGFSLFFRIPCRFGILPDPNFDPYGETLGKV